MSGEIVNLNKARKARFKAETSLTAAANRLAFGRTKAERSTAKTLKDKATHALDGYKRTPQDEA